MDAPKKLPNKSMYRRNVLRRIAALGVGGLMNGCLADSDNSNEIRYLGLNPVDIRGGGALPQVPLKIQDDNLVAVAPESNNDSNKEPSLSIADYSYTMKWYHYCGIQGNPSVHPAYTDESPPDENFRYDKGYDWHENKIGEEMSIQDFRDWQRYKGNAEHATRGLGKPANGVWRSGGPAPGLPVAVIKTDRDRLLDNAPSDRVRAWIRETCPRGFVAWLNKTMHPFFCRVPTGFQTSDFGCDDPDVPCAADYYYALGSNEIWDPFTIVEDSLVPSPQRRPDDGDT